MTSRAWLITFGAMNLAAALITGQQLNGVIVVAVLSVLYATRHDE